MVNNNEVLTTEMIDQQIGTFKNPEELAKALEGQNLYEKARRVREIFRNSTSDESKLAREILRKKLTPEEQKAIREALPGKGLDTILDKGMTRRETTGKTTEMVDGNQEVKKEAKKFGFDSILGFFYKFSNASEIYEKVSKAKGEGLGGMLAGIGAFLAYLFKGKLPEIEGIEWSFSKQTKEQSKEKPQNNVEKFDEDTKYRTLSSIFTSIYSKENKSNIVNILNTKKIEEIKIKDIPNILTKSDLKKELGLEQTSYTNTEIKETLEMFTIGRKNFLDNYYKNGYQEKSIKELILGIKDLYTIEEINNKVRKTDITDITKIGNIIGNCLNLDTNENGSLNQKANELGINQDIISSLLINDWDLNSLKEEDIKNNIDSSNIKDKDKVKDIIHFGYSFIKQLKSNEQLNLGFNEITSNIKIQPKDILKLYILTGGKKDFNFDELNDFQKSFTYISILGILDKGNDKLQGKYFTRLAGITYNEGEEKLEKFENKIPEGVKKIIGNSVNIGIETIKHKSMELGYEIIGIIEEKPEIILRIIGAISIIGWNKKIIPVIEIGKLAIKKIIK